MNIWTKAALIISVIYLPLAIKGDDWFGPFVHAILLTLLWSITGVLVMMASYSSLEKLRLYDPRVILLTIISGPICWLFAGLVILNEFLLWKLKKEAQSAKGQVGQSSTKE